MSATAAAAVADAVPVAGSGLTPAEFAAIAFGPTEGQSAPAVASDATATADAHTAPPASLPAGSTPFVPLVDFDDGDDGDDDSGGDAAAAAGGDGQPTGMRRRGAVPSAPSDQAPPFRVTSRYDPAVAEDRRQGIMNLPFYRKHSNIMWRIVQTIAWFIFPMKWVKMNPGDKIPPYGKWIKRNLMYICMAWMFCSQLSTLYFLWNIGALVNPLDQPEVREIVVLPPDMAAMTAQAKAHQIAGLATTMVALSNAQPARLASFTPTPVTYSQSNANYTAWIQDMKKAKTPHIADLPILTARVFMHDECKNINYGDLMLTLRSAQAVSCMEPPPDTCTCMSAPEIGIFANAVYYNGVLLLNVQVENRASVQPPVEIAFEGGKQKVLLPVGVRINATTVAGDPYETVVMKEDAWCILRALLLIGVEF